MSSTEKKDFFISYNEADVDYAQWIAWCLETEGGYSVVFDRWDFKVGSNFSLEVQKAISNSNKTIAIFSENYLKAQYTHPEWASAFADDPKGEKGLLIPVRVGKCNLEGLLRPIIYIDLVDITDEQIAKKTLLNKLRGDVRYEYEPKFPGQKIFGKKDTKPNRINVKSQCLDNLKNRRDFEDLIGRDDQLSELLRRISPSYRQHINIVDGIGGVGKTALVLEAAHKCRDTRDSGDELVASEIPIFDAIIFTSAKSTELKSTGIKNLDSTEKCLQDIYRTIAKVLKAPIINQATADNQRDKVYECLEQQSTLLIVDNMETIESSEKENILSFLAQLPKTTQAVITTREKLGDYPTISLAELSKKDAFEFIKQEARDKGDKGINISSQIAQYLYDKFGGIPVALKYLVGKIASGQKINPQEDNQNPLPDDVAQFCFESLVSGIRRQSAYKLLMALALFKGSPTEMSLAEVANLSKDHISVRKGLDLLKQLSLVKEEDGRYKILAITREYIKLEISNLDDFETAARKRLIQWYLKFTKHYGGLDWQDWRINYDKLDQELNNIIGVLDWCAIHDQYDDVKSIWGNIDNYVDLFGYWNLRIKWINWLIKQASSRSELATYVSLIANKAWALMLIGGDHLKEARELLIEAWRLKEYSNPLVQTEIYKNLAVLDIHYKHYKSSIRWLNKAKALLFKTEITDKELIRYQILLNYYRGRVQYFQENFENAEQIFKQIIKSGKEIEWQRFSNYAVHRLGELALMRNDLPLAKHYLKEALWIAQNNQELRRIVLVLISLARLEHKLGNRKQACMYEEEANQIGYYNSIGVGDIDDLKSLHSELECDLSN